MDLRSQRITRLLTPRAEWQVFRSSRRYACPCRTPRKTTGQPAWARANARMNSIKPRNSVRAAIALAGLLCAGCNSRPAAPTSKQPVTNEYHGVQVVDDYQWLETSSNPAVRQWGAAQNERSRAVLDKLPVRPLVEDRLTRLLQEAGTNYASLTWRRGEWFLLKF